MMGLELVNCGEVKLSLMKSNDLKSTFQGAVDVDKYYEVTDIKKNSPAHRDGWLVGDIIARVVMPDGFDAKEQNKKLNGVLARLWYKEGPDACPAGVNQPPEIAKHIRNDMRCLDLALQQQTGGAYDRLTQLPDGFVPGVGYKVEVLRRNAADKYNWHKVKLLKEIRDHTTQVKRFLKSMVKSIKEGDDTMDTAWGGGIHGSFDDKGYFRGAMRKGHEASSKQKPKKFNKWQYKNGAAWVDYPPNVCMQLDLGNDFQYTADNRQSYSISPRKKTQTNVQTGQTRKIRRRG